MGGNYETGQMFLHKVFGYRGVVLFPWLARVYDRDLPSKSSVNTREKLLDTENNLGAMGKEVKGKLAVNHHDNLTEAIFVLQGGLTLITKFSLMVGTVPTSLTGLRLSPSPS